jgi:hypothetical protein
MRQVFLLVNTQLMHIVQSIGTYSMHPLAVWAPVFACCLHRLVKCRTNREMAVSKLCSAAADAVERVGTLADCTLVADDGSRYQVSKAVMALHSRVLGCVGT